MYFNKYIIFTIKKSYTNIKQTLRIMLDNLSKIVKIIRKKIKNQLCKIYILYISKKIEALKICLILTYFNILNMRLVSIFYNC